jgi:hypothetical protein
MSYVYMAWLMPNTTSYLSPSCEGFRCCMRHVRSPNSDPPEYRTLIRCFSSKGFEMMANPNIGTFLRFSLLCVDG